MGEGMLCLADRNFACWELWHAAAAMGAELLWRVGASFTLPVEEVLPEGTYLSRLRAPRMPVDPGHLADLLWTMHSTKGQREVIYP